MNWLREAVVRWLRIERSEDQRERRDAEGLREEMQEITARQVLIARLKFALNNYDAVMAQLLRVESTMDAFAEALGIVVTYDGREASVAALRDPAHLERLKEYVSAVREMEVAIQMQARALRGQTTMFSVWLERYRAKHSK